MLALTQNRYLRGFIAAASALAVLHLLNEHFQFIFYQYPLEYRENTDLFRAYLLSIGKSIFAYENFPSSHSQYGFLYPWLGSRLLAYTGIHFYPLRLITALAMLPLLGLFLWQGLKEKLGALELFLICSIVYGSFLIHVGNMLAMPNTLGMAFFSLSVLLPPLLRFNRASLVASCVLAALGVFTKLYFGIGAFYILLYLLMNRKWDGFWFMSMCLFVTVAISTAIAVYLMPAFYEANIELNVTFAKWEPKYLWLQYRYFIKAFFAFILLLMACKWLCPNYAIFTAKNPYFFGLVVSNVALVKMGATSGQFFLYFHHLLIPFLVPLSIEIIKACNSKGKGAIAILLFLNLLFVHNLVMKHNDLGSAERSFKEIENSTALLDPHAELLYNSPTSFFAIKLKRVPNEHGQVEGLLFAKGEAGARYQAQVKSIDENIRERKYHQIFVDEWQRIKFSALSACYSKSKTFEVVMYAQRNPTEMWTPNSQCIKN